MNDEQIALARHAVACDHWRWMPGMRWCEQTSLGLSKSRLLDHEVDTFPPYYGCLPDLADPATLGCLLHLVREAWRCPTIYVRRSHVRRKSDNEFAWEVCDLWLDEEACRTLGLTRPGSVGCWGHKSEAEALVFALVNAP